MCVNPPTSGYEIGSINEIELNLIEIDLVIKVLYPLSPSTDGQMGDISMLLTNGRLLSHNTKSHQL